MLFARQVRGPLAFLKDHWEEPKNCLSSVLSYLLETRERLIDCIDLLKKINIRKAPTESVFRSESKEKTIWGYLTQFLYCCHQIHPNYLHNGKDHLRSQRKSVNYRVRMMKKNKDTVFQVNMLKKNMIVKANEKKTRLKKVYQL